jgi:ATPase subunit of ABC transporter with duplicated ATPase domains
VAGGGGGGGGGLLRGMDRILELSTLGARLHGGNWDRHVELKALEREAAGHRLAAAERRVREIDAKAQAARERQSRRDGRGRRERARGGQAKILLDARKETSERSAARADLLADRMRREAAEAAAAARAEVERLESLRVALAPSGLAPGRVVLDFRDVSGGPDGRTAVAKVSFTIRGPERVAVTGPNGSGKTTLLRLAAGQLVPAAGEVCRSGRAAILDQQVALLEPELSIAGNFRRLNPEDGENACRAALARFLFRADAALRLVGELSGGETLRAGLACVLGGRRPPELLLLDEPTNHLDLDAIAAVEAGLSAYDGALLVASHDEAFLEAIGITRRIALSPRSRPTGA